MIAFVCMLVVTSCAADATTTDPRHPDGSTRGTTTTEAPDARAVSTDRTVLAQAPTTTSLPPDLVVTHLPLTTENWESYEYRPGPGSVTIAAPRGLENDNIREVFWPSDATPVRDNEVCVTWDSELGPAAGLPLQPGLAMRIATSDDNRGLRAVTVTENVWMNGVWLFNVHVWDTLEPRPMQLLRTWNLADIVAPVAPGTDDAVRAFIDPPWHLCGRTRGDVFSFKVWADVDDEPSWSDPARVFSTQLPAGWDHIGYSGGYIGHLHDGQHATAILEHPTSG